MKNNFLILFLLFTIAGNAQNWEKTKFPAKTSPRFIDTAYGKLFAGSDKGLYVSSNKGDTWVQKTAGLNATEIFCFAATPNKLFVGANEGIFTSSDKGETWRMENSGIQYPRIASLTIMGNQIFAAVYDQVYISDINIVSWTVSQSSTFKGSTINTLFTDNKKLYAGSTKNGVAISSDSGTTWVQSTNGMMGSEIEIYDFEKIGNTIFAASFFGSRYLYFSSNEGATWAYPSEAGGSVMSLAVKGNNLFQGRVFGKLYVSSNMGKTATQIATGFTNNTVNTMFIDEKYLYISVYSDGIWRTNYSELVNGTEEYIGSKGQPYIWPQCVAQNSIIHINANSSLDKSLDFTLASTVGKIVRDVKEVSDKEDISLQGIPSGVYFYQIGNKEGGIIGKGKIIIE